MPDAIQPSIAKWSMRHDAAAGLLRNTNAAGRDGDVPAQSERGVNAIVDLARGVKRPLGDVADTGRPGPGHGLAAAPA